MLLRINFLIILFFLSSCSVYQASSGTKSSNLDVVRRGEVKSDIEMEIGSPISIDEIDGKKVFVYRFVTGAEKSDVRAASHVIANVMSMGVFEPFSSISETMRRQEFEAKVKYNSEDIASYVKITPLYELY